jgi:hypothetical protein
MASSLRREAAQVFEGGTLVRFTDAPLPAVQDQSILYVSTVQFVECSSE